MLTCRESVSSPFDMRSLLRWLFIAILAGSLVISTFGCDSSNDETVQMVKGGRLSNHPAKTIGQAIDSFFADPKWSSGVSDKGIDFVNAEGRINFAEKDVTAVLQFKVDKEKKTFEVNALEFNGVPQNMLMVNSLLEKIYEK